MIELLTYEILTSIWYFDAWHSTISRIIGSFVEFKHTFQFIWIRDGIECLVRVRVEREYPGYRLRCWGRRRQEKARVDSARSVWSCSFIVDDYYPIGTTCYFAAYAYVYVNHWMSCSKGNNFKHPAVQMHEIRHNLNLAHSGELDWMERRISDV